MALASQPPVQDSQPALTESFSTAIREFSRQLEPVFSPLRNAVSAIATILNEVQQEQERRLAPMRAAVERMMVLHAAAEKVHDPVLDALLARGWCHSYHFPYTLIIHLWDLIQADKTDEIDGLLAEFTCQRCDGILATACLKYPGRAVLLTDAFEAHRAGKYTLSIPALLAQLDGIGCEVMGMGRNFFQEKKRTSALAAILSQLKWPGVEKPYLLGGIHERMLSALERAWGLSSDTNLRRGDSEDSPLNRHGVLHGLDTNYPTEFNSLRCILLLGYLLEVRKVLHEDIPGELQEMAELLESNSLGNS